MARIKKKGLDYFPLSTDFMHDRAVRRLMKREGDAALGVLVKVLSYIYAGEGYYVRADRLFCEDLSAGLFQTSAEDVERIIGLAAEYGLFHEELYRNHGILTSEEIQRQYLFSIRRRKQTALLPEYSLLPTPQEEPSGRRCVPREMPEERPDDAAKRPQNVAKKGQNVTSGTHSIAQHSIAQQSTAEQRKENPLLCPPRQTAGEEGCPAGEEGGAEAGGVLSARACGRPVAARYRTWQDIEALAPPADGTRRNFPGLLENLRSYDIPPAEQYAIIRKSNYGAIGDPVWRGLATLRSAGGKIKLPGRYLLSLATRKEEAGAAVC